MNIIYYYHYCGSYNYPKEWRAYYLSKAFSDLGHNVTVIGASTHHMHREIIDQQEEVVSKFVESIEFKWLKVPKYIGNGLGRIKNNLSYAYSVWKLDPVADLSLNKPDFIIASSVHPFHVLGAIKWARRYRARVAFEVRDPWPLSLNLLLGLPKWHPFSLLLSSFQYIGHKFTDKTISLASNLEEYMRGHGLDEGKFIYACNGIDFDQELSQVSILDKDLKELRSRYKRIFMYTGSHGVPNALEHVIDAFNLVDDDIALVLIGDGTEKKNLIKRSSNPNCYFFGPVPKPQMQKVLSYSDVCIISWQNIPMYKYGVSPNKIFDYMWAKKPIIQAIDSPGNQVELASCGINVPPANPQAFKNAIEKMSSSLDSDLHALGENGYQYLKEHCQFNDIALKILNSVGS